MQSVKKMIAINSSEYQSFIEKWNELEENDIVLVYDNEFKNIKACDTVDFEKIDFIFNNDEKVLIVTFDIYNIEDELKYILHNNIESINNCPFFIKKKSDIDIPKTSNNLKVEIFKSVISKQYIFEHIAEPYFENYI